MSGEGISNAIGGDDVGSNKYSYQERILLSPNVVVTGRSSDNKKSNAPKISSWNVRLETHSSWNNQTWMHPFSSSLQGLLEKFPQVSRILVQSSSSPSNTASSEVSVASLLDDVPIFGGSSGRDGKVGLWSPPSNRGPSGVFIHVHVRKGGGGADKSKLVSSVVTELVERRLVVAPVGSSKHYDVLSETDDGGWIFQIILPTDGSQMSADAIEQSFVSFTPSVCRNRNRGGGGMLSHSTILSEIFLGEHKLFRMKSPTRNVLLGSNNRRTMWLDISSSSNKGDQWKISQGVQYTLSYIKDVTSLNRWSSWILPGMMNNTIEPCSLVTEPLSVQLIVPTKIKSTTSDGGNGYELLPMSTQTDGASAATTEESILTAYDMDNSSNESSKLSIYKAARRPYGISNRGRLETTVTTNDSNDGPATGCVAQISLREIIPSFVIPKWRTLQATVTTTTKDEEAEKSTTFKIQPNVEFRTIPSILGGIKDDNIHSMIQQDAIVSVDAYLPPKSSLLVSVDYEPAFLTFEEFPGDPNRGMEVTPSIVTFQCIDETLGGKNSFLRNETTHDNVAGGNYYQLYSNTVLILPPVPDMSMPFNVTSLTCSVFAYVVGSVIALLIKKSNEKIRYKLYPEEIPKSKLKVLKERIREKITSKLFSRNKAAKKSDDEGEDNEQKDQQKEHENSETAIENGGNGKRDDS